ncbi:glycosyl hydrolase family 28-related protein [Ramlibacter sp.]|uniref:glycosyl hydrolase family 28-related protein n=1 Tax=Ramlibacter sp. TaxID=1917967 RepID=UPI0026028329|nr:glycosyl hydrolase family 28-related protein [Ramlibacter sp.]MDB5957088.1 hypothetical protein [Ramlibacter sp.]
MGSRRKIIQSTIAGVVFLQAEARAQQVQQIQRAPKPLEHFSVFDYMSAEEVLDVQSYSPYATPPRLPRLDVTAKIQKAIDQNYRVYFPAGAYLVSAPIRIRGRSQIAGESPAVDHGTVFYANPAARWAPDRGVLETKNFSWAPNLSEGAKPDFWHWGLLEDLAVICNGVADYGIVIWCVGEESRLTRCDVRNAVKANIFMGGEMAVGHLDNCSTWYSSKGVGLLMDNHPVAGFASGISAPSGGRGNGGSIRLIGLSGDHNALGHIKATGSQIVDVVGLKSEYNTPCITIAGVGADNGRQRWNITGYRFASERLGADRDFIQIQGSAKPQIVVGAGACYNARYLINDAVLGVTIAPAAEGFPVFYDQDYGVQMRTRNARFPGSVTFQSDGKADNAMLTMRHANAADVAYSIGALNLASDQVQFTTGSISNKIFTVSNAAHGDVLDLWCYDGSRTQRTVRLANSEGAASVMLAMGASQKVGFYGAKPVARQRVAGSRGGNGALADLLNKLATLGLITDATTD